MPAAQAAKEETPVFLLAADVRPELIENPHRGHRLPTAALYLGITIANSNTTSGLRVFLYDSGRRSRSTGKERDAESGLDYFGYRYMSSAQGRFTSPDEVFADQHARDPQSWNMYAYVRNNPLRFTDADGRECTDGKDESGNACFTVTGTAKAPNPILNFFAGIFKGIGQAVYNFANLNGEMGMTQEGQQMQQSLQPTNSAQQRGVNVATVGALLVPGPQIEELNPASIMFSQKSVNGLDEIVASMSANGWVGGPVDVVRMADGTVVTLDNTRVLAASQTGTNVQAVVHDAGEALPPSQIQRFTTSAGAPSTWGQAAQYRIQNQGAGFSSQYPNGSAVTGVK